MSGVEEDGFKQFHQTQKLYSSIREFYTTKTTVNPSMPFPIVTVYINLCIRKFYRKPRQKVIYLSLKYLDEIGYKYD